MADEQGQVFDEQRILRFIELMKEHDLRKLDLQQGEQRICIKRGGAAPAMPGFAPGFAPPQYAPPAYPVAPQSAPSAPQAAAADSRADENIVVIKAPMVGTYYNKPNPNAGPYVKVGDHVDKDTIICIIEAMKVFNEIPAEVSGKVVAILVDDEEAVEFGKPLFRIDTRG